MGLGKLFRLKRSKPASPDANVQVPEGKPDAPSPIQKSEQFAKVNGNTVHQDEKATSFPPPLSIDASVFTEPAPVIRHPEIKKGRTSRGNGKDEQEDPKSDEKGKQDEAKDDKHSLGSVVCDSKTCAKENCKADTCETGVKRQHESGDKISPHKLTEMINSSIQEAMQTIAKQCRMEEDTDVDKKTRELVDKSVCRSNKEDIPIKGKHDYRRTIQEQLNNRSKSLNDNALKSSRLQGRCNRVRPCSKKTREENVSSKREDKSKDSRSKRHSKSANNVKTDNRRMTGNVNIYICSEATENAQATGKQKKSQPCTETSSETTTERSDISSSKLVTSIRKRRSRKSKELDSFDSLPKEEQSSETSNACSCVSKYTDSDTATKLESSDFIDVCHNLEDVSSKDTASTLIEYQCKDTNLSNSGITDKSDHSFQRSKFLVREKFEKPCATYVSKIASISDSDEWSLKTICSNVERVNYSQNTNSDREVGKERVPCDQKRNDTWSLESASTNSNYLEKRDFEATENDRFGSFKRNFVACKCLQNDREFVECNDAGSQNNHRSKKRFRGEKDDSKKPWSTCSCIAEEEEDVCVEIKRSQESTVCQRSTEPIKREPDLSPEDAERLKDHPTKFVTCRKHSTEDNKDEEKLQKGSNLDVETVEKEETSGIETVEEKVIEGDKKEEIDEGSKVEELEKQEKKIPPPVGGPTYTYTKLLRPEARLLKQILKQQTKPPAQDAPPGSNNPRNISSNPGKEINVSNQPNKDANIQNPIKPQPAFLRKFNLRQLHIPAQKEKEKDEEKKETSEDTAEKKSEDKKEEEPEAEEKKKSFQERLKDSFLCRIVKKVIGRTERPKTKTEEFTEKDKITAPTDIDTSKKIDSSENTIQKPESPTEPKIEIKEMHRDKFIPPRLNLQKIIKRRDKPEEPNTVVLEKAVTDEKDKETVKDTTPKIVPAPTPPAPTPADPMKKEDVAKDEKEEVDVAKENQNKSKLLSAIGNRLSQSTKDANSELRKEGKSRDPRKSIETQEIMKPPKEPEVEKKEEGKKSEPVNIATRNEKESDAKRHSVEKEAAVCVHCVRRKLSTKEKQYPQIPESESHTVCTDSKFTRYNDVDQGFSVDEKRFEESRCNCCYLPASQCSNGPVNYPKSCLKKERPSCRVGCSHENNCSVTRYGNRNWEECDCRQIIVCDNCCRPRYECSCRRTITCVNCCKPKNDCSCKSLYRMKNPCGCMKSMFCLYCDNPREKCTCSRAPVRNCSCCDLSMDLCACKDQETFYDGRPVQTEPDNDRTMYVTAWKPREEVRRYFSRNLDDLRGNSTVECCCYEKLKPHNSDDLPYQRLSVFSDVMDELQQKISESTCCTQCRKNPCCCTAVPDRDERMQERKIKYCVSYCKVNCISCKTQGAIFDRSSTYSSYFLCPKTRRKIIAVCMEKSKSKPANGCKCDSSQGKPDRQKKIIVAVCCVCKTTPCRCRISKSSPKKPKAKCYYCKSSPCVCIAARERNKPRPCRCADSPCRTKEKEIVPCGKTSTKPRNNEEKIICVR